MSDQVVYPPMPKPDAVSEFFWSGVDRHQLLIQRCASCRTFQHPPKVICSTCLSTDLVPEAVSGAATLVTWTQPVKAYDPYFATHQPYIFATVNLAEQVPLRFATNLVDCNGDELRIDQPLSVTFREVAPGCTLPLFGPGRG
ncbi:zinc ribbon domain-containing protein [Mycobacterium sp. MBM]|nr:zinc ribbon domain-containing protein [Mycobacterium sp. MBM]